ncbi:2-C-methyl-D-erythritol 4-phosphate cytidylyltransferase [Aquibacillus koreensis]|uniref:2-C-methyl-D-erythritol 4-phosphate cytidylyltransferase n=1 Tax=Aquibacillus koreensis TaxID=279446 RepID=A0A9X4ALG2_9BACI|nr:2-C-methyl-D-erythritol 4-phosphate cytidylyltransferase [Aquibacillus koreensis]MCT2536627.1 2-C-methyl-D-erythritol 4-phosphate cytidylyltransferase [Aquibacillus koreensis]MDC3422425.1 2-C-methyl-D-erythritol 4-phosphate cytidylyltransferase [Aquibacillus koreensis]
MEYIAIVLAAGQGKRMNAGENKQFITLVDQPLIIHTLQVFAKDAWCKSIVLVVNSREKQRIEQLVDGFSLQKDICIVEGGAERQESVFKGLRSINDPESLVFIHDGARPFVTRDHLHKLAEVASQKQAALLAVPVTDTIKERNGEKLTTLDRSVLWAAQTPQAFQFDLIYKAHKSALDEAFIGTDDASLVEKLGYPVQIVEGSYQNIKLTTPEDLERAHSILKSGIKEI